MRCLKRTGKYQACTVIFRSREIQVFKNREFLVHSGNEPDQIRNRHLEADAAHAITALKRKDYSFFFLCGDVVVVANVVDNKRKGRRMCQHVCYWGAICTDEAKTQVGRRPK